MDNYIYNNSSEKNGVLEELFRKTNLKMIHPRMLSGYSQGRLLSFISRLKRPEKILEIGTYTGYSAICLSEGLKKDGKLITIELEDELEDFILEYFNKAGIENKTDLIIGDAKTELKKLDEVFDIIFIDGNKREYPEYFKLCKDKIKQGGILIADNVLWDNKVMEKPDDNDYQTKGIIEFTKMINDDDEFENFIVPVRDGLLIAEKK